MNSDTGHLVRHEPRKPLDAGYELLPRWLRKIALEELRGKQETTVDLAADTPLSHFAASRRAAAVAKRERRKARNLAQRAT